ncbi:MAG: HPr family phosphocarrier protein, partial [Pseudonocardiaceae bacterium]
MKNPVGGELVATFTVTNAHGLHARPASRLVQAVRRLDAHLRLRDLTTGSPWVSAASLSKLVTLGALRGHEIEVRAGGRQARAALDGVVALAARGFDDGQDNPAPPPPSGALSGRGSGHSPIAASPGIGIGPAWSLRVAPLTVVYTRTDDPTVQWGRFMQALATVRRDIQRVQTRVVHKMGDTEAAIFDAHLLLLDDTDLVGEVRSRVDGGQAAASAWSAAVT